MEYPMTLRDSLDMKKDTRVGDTFVGMLQSVEKMDSGLNDVSKHLEDKDRWMREWNDMVQIGELAKSSDTADGGQYDVSIFGPKLRSKRLDVDAHATETNKLLLCKDSDYVDAMLTVDRDNFLADPFECAMRDCNIVRQLCGFLYTNMRDFYISMPIEDAMVKINSYREHIRCLRSLLHMARVLSDDCSELQQKLVNADVLKEKYEATIFTLRRQLQDMHAAQNTVGRGVDGTVGVHDVADAGTPQFPVAQADFSDGSSAVKADNKYIICVQVEGVGGLRARHRNVMDRAIATARRTVCDLANAYDVQRTNYVKSDVRDDEIDEKENPTSFLFVGSEGFNAVAFAVEAHVQLNECEQWPKALTDMTRFGSELWHGLRVRVGIHIGQPNMMDLPEASAIPHYEGLAVEKCLRVAALGTCGEVVLSQLAWEAYMQEVKEARVPPAKRYQHIRAMTTESINCAKKRGFKKGEVCTKCWAPALSARQSQTIEAEFPLISFYRLEAGNTAVEEDDEPTVDELMAVKDTEITLLQQELDVLRLEVVKRDTDLGDLRTQMMYAISKLHERSRVKTFLNRTIMSGLESQLMEMHEFASYQAGNGCDSVSNISAQSPSAEKVTLEETEKRRKRMYIEWAKELEEHDAEDMVEDSQPRHRQGASFHRRRGSSADKDRPDKTPTSESIGSRRGSQTDLFKIPKHKNQKLWRELTTMVKGTTKKLVQPKRGIQRTNSSGALNPNLFKLHSVVRVYSELMKRYLVEGDKKDQDNQSISEEQFIGLFIQKLQPDANIATAREAMSLLTTAAIENLEVESSCQSDDARLIRSIGGHMGKVFNCVKIVKKKVHMTENLLQEARDHAAELEANEMAGGTAGKKSKKSSKSVSGEKKLGAKTPQPQALKTPGTDRLSIDDAGGGGGAVGGRPRGASMKAPPPGIGSTAAKLGSRAQSADRTNQLERENKTLQQQLETLKKQLDKKENSGSARSGPAGSRRSSIGPTSSHGVARTGKRASISGAGAIPSSKQHASGAPRASSGAPTAPPSRRNSITRSSRSSIDAGCQTPTDGALEPQISFEAEEIQTPTNQSKPSKRHVGVQVRTCCKLKMNATSSSSHNKKAVGSSSHAATEDIGSKVVASDSDDNEESHGPPHASATFRAAQDWSGAFGGDDNQEKDAAHDGALHRLDSLASVATSAPKLDRSSSVAEVAVTITGAPADPDTEANLSHPVNDVSPGGSLLPDVGPNRTPRSPGQIPDLSPRLGQHVAVPVADPLAGVPERNEVEATEVEAFSMEERHQQLKEKWAREKEEREQAKEKKRRATLSPSRGYIGMDLQNAPKRAQSPNASPRSSKPGSADAAASPADKDWKPKITLAPLRPRVTASGGLELVGERQQVGSPGTAAILGTTSAPSNTQSPPPLKNNNGTGIGSASKNGGGGGQPMLGITHTSGTDALTRQRQEQKDRELYEQHQAELQQQLVQLRQLQEQSKALMGGSGHSSKSSSSVGSSVPSSMVVGSVGPVVRSVSRQGGTRPMSQQMGRVQTPSTTNQSQIGYAAQQNTFGGGGLTATQLKPKSDAVASIAKQYGRKQ